MRILFVVDPSNRVRHFKSVVQLLAKRGHHITLAMEPRRESLPAGLDHSPMISPQVAVDRRADAWRDYSKLLRAIRDYARYLSPRYAKAEKLRHRAAMTQARGFAAYCDSHPRVRRQWRLLGFALKLAEDLIPSDAAFEATIKAARPDIILLTPLIRFGSYQTDYVKSAHKLGVPVAFLPFSWDNLSNRGLIRVIPDRVLVWNAIQQQEAVELHGVPRQRVVVTGAPRFDEFFAFRPSTTRKEFCRQAGLDPAQPFILYLCSAPFVAKREVEFVRRWAKEVRRSEDPALKACGLLVRPHPAHLEQWRGDELADLPNVALWPLTIAKMGGQTLYDSIHHAATVVGLNTSAQIEAGILGKSVHTILASEFAGGQEGTLHFHYLLQENGGLVAVARDFDEHRRQLAAALQSDPARREQTLRFVESFVRPRGLNRRVTPIMANEIERLAGLRKRPQRLTPLWHYPLRWALLTWLQAARKRRGPKPRPLEAQPEGGPARGKASRLDGLGKGKVGKLKDPTKSRASKRDGVYPGDARKPRPERTRAEASSLGGGTGWPATRPGEEQD